MKRWSAANHLPTTKRNRQMRRCLVILVFYINVDCSGWFYLPRAEQRLTPAALCENNIRSLLSEKLTSTTPKQFVALNFSRIFFFVKVTTKSWKISGWKTLKSVLMKPMSAVMVTAGRGVCWTHRFYALCFFNLPFFHFLTSCLMCTQTWLCTHAITAFSPTVA